MSSPEEVVRSMCGAYEAAVNANDSAAYGQLFIADAIRMPPGGRPEYGRDQIQQSEQSDYDAGCWSIRSTPVDALEVADGWIYGIAQVEGSSTAHADGATKSFRLTKSWLLQRQRSGDWLIARQMWNHRPADPEKT